MKQTFKKEERLSSKNSLDKLFRSGKSFLIPPLRFVWISSSHKIPVQVAFSVPKKLFNKAVQRNRIRRRLREAYRKNKNIIYEILKKKNLSLDLMIIYLEKEEHDYKAIEHKMVVSLRKLTEKMQ